MKNIYFVRHGESVGNAGNSYQGPASPLSDKGKQQAEIIAKRCSQLPVDIIISSTLERAKQTAEIISGRISKEIQFSDLFIENRRPTAQIGLVRDSVEAEAIDKAFWENFPKIDGHHSDEENFYDLEKRAGLVIEFLKNRKEDNILVVTHGLFLRVILGKVLFGNDFTSANYFGFYYKLKTNNTGVTLFEYYPEKNQWGVRTWNDHAHLG